MSIPKNHHYVSQCHQKEFLNQRTGRIYLYDKELNNFYNKKSTKRLFSKDHLNTKVINGKIDQSSLEQELKALFEDKFNNYILQIQNFLISQEKLQETYEAMCWLVMLGILGELRHPNFKESLDEKMINFQVDVFSKMYGFEKEKVKAYLVSKKKTPYDNSFSYISIALRILEKLEPIDFMIYCIKSNDHFLLPDTSCFQLRGQLKNYPNPFIREIIQIGIPVTDKLFILATPQSLKTKFHGIYFIEEDNSIVVDRINKDLYEFARKAVACKDEHYLESAVVRLKEMSS